MLFEPPVRKRQNSGKLVAAVRCADRDARKWYASKLAPKKYGDRLEVEVSAELTHKEVTRDALRKLTPEELELYENLLAKVNQAAIGSAGEVVDVVPESENGAGEKHHGQRGQLTSQRCSQDARN